MWSDQCGLNKLNAALESSGVKSPIAYESSGAETPIRLQCGLNKLLIFLYAAWCFSDSSDTDGALFKETEVTEPRHWLICSHSAVHNFICVNQSTSVTISV